MGYLENLRRLIQNKAWPDAIVSHKNALAGLKDSHSDETKYKKQAYDSENDTFPFCGF